MAALSARETQCAAPGCAAFGQWVFCWPVNGAERTVRACSEHRGRGEAWLARAKGEGQAVDAATAAATAPPQKSLF
ncbi:MAG: hypothetical protein AB7I36_08335 [Rhodospirillaceae bacterium]